MLNNQLPTKILVELNDNSSMLDGVCHTCQHDILTHMDIDILVLDIIFSTSKA